MSRGVLLAIAAAIIASSLFGFLAWIYVQPHSPSEKKDFLQLITQIIGGIALIASLVFTWLNLHLTQKTTAENIANAHETLRISQDGQVTERFVKAIDQLGSKERLELRLGAIYTLERLSRMSEKDYWPIVDLMCAFVRSNAPSGNAKRSAPERMDIQAAMTMIGRRQPPQGAEEAAPLYLADTDLRELHLEQANLEGAVLWNASLEGSVLVQANLRRARLTGVSLKQANLAEAHCENALFSYTSVEGANFSQTHLEGADLSQALGLTKEHLKDAHLDATTKLPHGLSARHRARSTPRDHASGKT